jgi:parallel beta-helix repeat protein
MSVRPVSVRSKWLHAIPVALAFSAVLVWSSSAPRASHVNCGDVITQNVTLDSDLVDCPGNGLVIGAPHITVNLNGHVIDGDGVGFDSGIDNFAGHDQVTIRNGEIREFASGVVMAGTKNSRLTNLTLASNGAGLALIFDSDNNHVERCDITGNNTGVFLQSGSDGNTLSMNRIEDNVQSGLAIDASDDNRVQRNDINRNGGGGIFVSGGSDRTKIEKNDLKNNGLPAGIAVDGGSDNAIVKNDLEKNQDGIFVSSSAVNVLIEKNESNKNTFDGLDINTTSAEITMNVANKNGDLGIEAEPGVTDGGGNRARGNTNPLQCTGVTCK